LKGPFVGIVEIIRGMLIILGLFTRLAAIALIIIMIVAIVSTKVPIALGHDFWIFLSAQTAALRLLEHDARSARGFRHAAGRALPPDRGRRRMVAGRPARPTPGITIWGRNKP
jgi:hypothetical protein